MAVTLHTHAPLNLANVTFILRDKGLKRRYTILERFDIRNNAIVCKVQTIVNGQIKMFSLKLHFEGERFRKESAKEVETLRKLREAPHVVRWLEDFDLAPVCYGNFHPQLCIRQNERDKRHAILMDPLWPNMQRKYIQGLPDTESTSLLSSVVENITVQTLEMLAYLDSKDMVYGNLGPFNMSYNESSRQLTFYNFESATEIGNLNPKTILQPRTYRAPERLLFKPYEKCLNMDIWSLAVCLFELYTGYQLFSFVGKDDEPDTIIDDLHILYNVLGNYDFTLPRPPSAKAQEIIDSTQEIKTSYPDIPIWQAFLYNAAEVKGESPIAAKRLIALIDPMLQLKGRIRPEEALEKMGITFLAKPIQPPSSSRPILYDQNSHKPYILLQKIGEGSYGQVWKVLTPEKSEAALKIHRFVTEELLKRFRVDVYLEASLTEADWFQFIKGMPHIIGYQNNFYLKPACHKSIDENLCIVHEKRDKQRHAILMDLLPCKSIGDKLDARDEIFSCADIMEIVRQALETLQAFELNELIYCDLKPENMAYHQKKLFFYDFGSMKQVEQVDPTVMLQSRYYRAPEVFLSKQYNELVDIWSLACTLFEIYTGEVLFLSTGEDSEPLTISDHLYIMMKNIGNGLSDSFIRSSGDAGVKFYAKEKTGFTLKFPPTLAAAREIYRYDHLTLDYPGVPLWQARMYAAWEKKDNEASEDPTPLIRLISEMLAYENRASASTLLEKYFPSEEKKVATI